MVGEGVASTTLNIEHFSRLSDHCSIFTAEMAAIVTAVEEVNRQVEDTPGKTAILTDSLSSVLALQKSCPKHHRIDLISRVRDVTTELAMKGHEVVVVWIPAHVGIPGNEKADGLANLGRDYRIITRDVKLGASEMKALIKKRLRAIKWNHTWRNEPDHAAFTKSLIPDVQAGYCMPHSRGTLEKLTRLRLGNPIFKATGDNYCQECDTEKSISHVILTCSKHVAQRDKLALEYFKQGLKFDLHNILSHRCKPSIRSHNKHFINTLNELI